MKIIASSGAFQLYAIRQGTPASVQKREEPAQAGLLPAGSLFFSLKRRHIYRIDGL